jgi:hypothetical protein
MPHSRIGIQALGKGASVAKRNVDAQVNYVRKAVEVFGRPKEGSTLGSLPGGC